MHSDWILFEAGALSKTIINTHVCPVLIGLEPSDVQGPLAQFQATRANKEEISSLLVTINAALGDKALADDHLREAFNMWWPKLDEALTGLPPDDAGGSPRRSERDILEEVLALVRNQARSSEGPLADRLYTPGHASRRVQRAVKSILTDKKYGEVIRDWTVAKSDSHVIVKIDTATGIRRLILPISFQSMDDIRSAVTKRLDEALKDSSNDPKPSRRTKLTRVASKKTSKGRVDGR